jgi:hypothetical protein
MSLVSDIKLIRTDTTLDLSQKAEKGIPLHCFPPIVVSLRSPYPFQTVWDNALCCSSSPPSAQLLSSSAPGVLPSLTFPTPCPMYTQHTGRVPFNSTGDLKHMTLRYVYFEERNLEAAIIERGVIHNSSDHPLIYRIPW